MEIDIMVEAIMSGIAKFGWILVGGVIARQEWDRRQDKKRLEDTYTKKETQEQIKSHLKPLEVQLSYISMHIEQTNKGIDEIRIATQSLDKSISVIEATIPKRKDDR